MGLHKMAELRAASQLLPGPGGGKPPAFWALYPSAFSPSECAILRDAFAQLDRHDGGLVAGRFDAKVRQSVLVWLPEDDAFLWVHRRIAQLVADANRDVFHYALDGIDEELQLAAYGPGYYYDWHIDRGRGATAGRRKLSLSVQLSPPDAYMGGALTLNANGRPFQVPRDQGTAIVFAAHTIHRVAPVVSGLRHSLVTWVHGPDFV